MYSITSYGSMIADQVRMTAYTQALQQIIKPGDLVLEIGTGTGIFALLACQLGARQVIAIEPNDAIQVARQSATANGYGEQIRFIQEMSTHVTLPERADVIISDMRGVLPLHEQHIPSLVDARQRLLAPGGVLIPQCDTIWATVVDAPALYDQFYAPWETHPYAFDLRAARPFITNTWCKGRVQPEQCLAPAQLWATLDYQTIENPNVHGKLTWTVTTPGIGHGLNLWFDATLVPGVTFSNAPAAPKAIYGAAFFPWSQPVPLAVGDVVSAFLGADLVGENYIWRWESCVLEQGDAKRVKASFKQSTFHASPLSLPQLHKQAASYTPSLSAEGRVDQWLLSRMNGQSTLADLAQALQEHFPQRFDHTAKALAKVGEISRKYSC